MKEICILKKLFLKKYNNPLSDKERKILKELFYIDNLSSEKKDFLIKSAQYEQWYKNRVIDTLDALFELEAKISSDYSEILTEMIYKVGHPYNLIYDAQGDVSASANLGYYYYTGLGVDCDLPKAFQYFLKAAKKK